MLLLLASYATPHISPAQWSVPALLGLSYPFLLIVNGLFFLFWAFKRDRRFWASLLAILFGWPILTKTVTFNGFNTAARTADSTTFKVMSYNVRNFDLYNWNKNKESRQDMLQLVKQQNPDLLFFQDFYTQDDSSFNNIETISNDLQYPYYHFEPWLNQSDSAFFGLAIFSRFPLSDPQRIEFHNGEFNLATSIDADISGRKLRLFNTHFQSIHLAQRDLQYVRNLNKYISDSTREDNWRSITSIVGKLKQGYVKRSSQAELLATYIDHSPYPVLVAGDFNDTPNSYTYRTVAGSLQDSFLKGGNGAGGTFSFGGLVPAFRIDYILADTSLTVQHAKVVRSPLNHSDHHPVQCTIQL